jgi:hypothetical protein
MLLSGIQADHRRSARIGLLDSRLKHAGMTLRRYGVNQSGNRCKTKADTGWRCIR